MTEQTINEGKDGDQVGKINSRKKGEEEWKPIVGYEGYYEVSNYGNVRSIERTARFVSIRGRECVRSVRGRVLNKTINSRQGRESVMLSKENEKKRVSVHRLVAQAFCDNPNGYTEVNHIDENPLNNNADNLEWCTRSYNMHYGTLRERLYDKNKRPLIAYNDVGDVILFNSVKAAEKMGIPRSNIYYSMKQGKKCNGYYWRYDNGE